MQNFIVLGYIPGTQTQIDFTTWFVTVVVLVSVLTIRAKRQQLRYWAQYTRIALDIKRHPLK